MSNGRIKNRRPGGESTHKISYFIHRSICGTANTQILNWSERCGDLHILKTREHRAPLTASLLINWISGTFETLSIRQKPRNKTHSSRPTNYLVATLHCLRPGSIRRATPHGVEGVPRPWAVWNNNGSLRLSLIVSPLQRLPVCYPFHKLLLAYSSLSSIPGRRPAVPTTAIPAPAIAASVCCFMQLD